MMEGKLWLDDIRPPPPGYTWVKTYEDAVTLLSSTLWSEVSLDHDLGTDKTGYDLLCWMEEKIYNGKLSTPRIYVHSQNPVGVQKMKAAITKIYSFCPPPGGPNEDTSHCTEPPAARAPSPVEGVRPIPQPRAKPVEVIPYCKPVPGQENSLPDRSRTGSLSRTLLIVKRKETYGAKLTDRVGKKYQVLLEVMIEVPRQREWWLLWSHQIGTLDLVGTWTDNEGKKWGLSATPVSGSIRINEKSWIWF